MNENIEKPEMIKFFIDKKVSLIAAGGYHSLALAVNENEILYSWGSGIYGEIGTGEFADANLPKEVKIGINKINKEDLNLQNIIISNKESIIKISAGGHHTVVLTSNLKLYAFGFGAYGQLGIIPN